jgi:hypothetical protein
MYSLFAVHVWLVVMSALTKILAARAGVAPSMLATPARIVAILALFPMLLTRVLLFESSVGRGVTRGFYGGRVTDR